MTLNISLRTLFFSFLFASVTCQAQFEPTLSELSGNGPAADGKGYVYQFSGDFFSNCLFNASSDSYNQSSSINYSYTLDTLNGFFQLRFNGKQENTEVLCNHFVAHNCEFIELSPSGYLDLSNESHRMVELKVKSTVNVERFGVLIVVDGKDKVFHLGDGAEHAPVGLTAGKWKVIKIPLAFERWDSLELDPKRAMGIAFYARNATGNAPLGNIDIDYIRIGSAVKRSIASGTVSPTQKGYAFTFKGDALHTCTRPFNTTGNRNLNLQVDQATHQAVLTQQVTPSRYDIFGIEFTDEDCFLKSISLKEEKNRFVEIKIKPDTDILSFGISVAGKSNEDKLWNYSQVVEYVPLKGGVWNTVKVPVAFLTQANSTLNPFKITGVVLAVNPHSETETPETTPATVKYTIEYIKVGDAILAK
ncbi:MAG: hypothetical protein K0R51_3441 [Cytophagaceae bacterium]|jgi:hypothetical protein|nr:hypothetical protein [Cytophagaceae bacterium]